MNAIRPLVGQVLGSLGPSAIAPTCEEALSAWVHLTLQWNERVDLTAARSLEEAVDLLVADAALVSRWIEPGARWVDVGTGAGAPGMGLAMLCSEASLTLVEPMEKRVSFLRTVLGSARRADVMVVRGKGEDIVAKGETFDGAIARATLPPPAWLALGHRLSPSGAVVVLLAREEPPALDGRVIADDVSYLWPLTGASRRAVRYVPG